MYKQRRGGGLHLRSLDDILRDEKIEKALGVDAVFYLRVLLSDQRGWNVRNCICHGMYSSADFNVAVADRVLHALLLLAVVRIEESGGE